MAVQLILKNSSVEDRHPTANQLTNGEISLNYNEAGAFLSCRDTNGDIQHIGGVKIDDATPGSPSKQALWFQPSTSKLFIYDGTGWLVVASGGGSGPGSDTVDQILAGNGINSDPSTGLGVITLDADLNFSRGLEFVAGQIAVALGVGLEFDVNGRVANTLGAVQYRGTLDLTSSDPRPTSPVQGDTWVNTTDGTSNAVWNPDIPTGTTVEVGDLVIYNGTIWTFLARGLSPAERTDLGLGVVDDVSVEVTSSTGSNVQLPAATGTTAGVLTAADKVIIDEGASTWERNGSILQPVDDTYNVEIGGGNITLTSAGGITTSFFTLSRISNPKLVIESPGDDSTARAVAVSYNFSDGGGAAIQATRVASATASDVYLSFRTGGTTNSEERMRIDSTGDVLIGGTLPSAPNITLASSGAITAGTYNTLTVGRGPSGISTNTVVGFGAFAANTTGNNSTAIGRLALANNTIGNNNTAVGTQALLTNTEGSANTAHGFNALRFSTTGGSNTGTGFRALYSNTEGSNNTAMGRETLYSNITGDRNAALGYLSGYYIEGSNNTILGAYQGTAADATLSDTVIISAGATERMRIDSSGNSNFTIPTLTNNTSGDVLLFRDIDTNTVGAGLRLARYQNAQNYGLGIYTSQGSTVEAVRVANTGDVLIGGTLPSAPNITLANSGSITAGTYNTLTLGAPTAGSTAVGTASLEAITTGTSNVALGNRALRQLTTGSNNLAVGYQTLIASNGSNNTGVGNNTLNQSTTGGKNTALGSGALADNISGNNNVAIGYQSGQAFTGGNNTILGPYVGTAADSTINNTVVISAGVNEKLRIDSAGSLLFGGTLPSAPNITLASDGAITALADATINNVTVGLGGGSVTANTAVGRTALPSNTTGNFNTAVGRESLNSNTEGNSNTAVGRQVLNNNTTGSLNTATGQSAGYYIEGSNNTILGAYTGTTADSTLSDTVIISAGRTERARCDSSGTWQFTGKLVSASTVFGDGGTTLTTKDYVDSAAYAGIPQNAQTSAYTLASTDNGQHISITIGGVTVPSAVFSVGDTISIYNNSAADQTITQGASVTLRFAGTADTGNRTLAQRGLATVLCVGSDEFVISGGGLS